ncbi:MAG: inositol monophosphatase [Alphaproteobacteria bacterium]|nr:inositol monophosphatase [Alphaproteobacteria bacterium]
MIELAREAARAAGAIQREAWLGRGAEPTRRDVPGLRHKGAVDLVTEIDLASEARIVEILTAGAPEIPVLAEEGGGARRAGTRWIIDPLDGTTNFVHGFPQFAVSIALQREGALELAVVYDPTRDELFEARAGQGATLNGRPIRTSITPSLDQALVASGFPYDRRVNADRYLRYVRAFLMTAQGFRRAGAAALDLAWVACGRLDGCWEFGLQPWDVAAGALLIQEAGGRISDMDLSPLDIDAPRVLGSNGILHAAMHAVLAPLLAQEED